MRQLPPKSEATESRILECALELFRIQGFERTTMREIAREAEVAVGAAYYYFPSKDAIVLEFYRRATAAMQPEIELAVENSKSFEAALSAVIETKLTHFNPHRGVLRSILRNGADPGTPVSPFSKETQAIRDADLDWFRRIVSEYRPKCPKDLESQLPLILWFLQMGVIYFWVIEESESQSRTARLLTLACGITSKLIGLSSLPLMRPMRKPLLELIALATGADT